MDVKYFGFILFNFCVSLAHKPLEISPNIEEIHLKENDVLEITCTGSNPAFIYPKNPAYASTSKVQISINNNDPNSHSIILKRNKTVYGDTGWYGCVDAVELANFENPKNNDLTPYNYNDPNIKWIYVYVKSNIHHFVESVISHQHPREGQLRVEEGDDFVLPCRSTSLEYNITLDNLKKKYSHKVRPDDQIIHDPKRGFIIKNITWDENGVYQCFSEVYDYRNFHFLIKDKVQNLRKPSISYSVEHLVSDGELRMNCSVEIDINTNYQLNMAIPNKSLRVSRTWYTETINSCKEKAVLQLVISNFTQIDEGEFTCTVRTNSVSNSTSITVTLNDAAAEFQTSKANICRGKGQENGDGTTPKLIEVKSQNIINRYDIWGLQ